MLSLALFSMRTVDSMVSEFRFVADYKNLREILMDHELANLGDLYVNLLYSLALSELRGRPVGMRVDSRILADALRRAGLRSLLPSRTDRHRQADAVEALIVYAWVRGLMSLRDGVEILRRYEDPAEAFCQLILEVRRRLGM